MFSFESQCLSYWISFVLAPTLGGRNNSPSGDGVNLLFDVNFVFFVGRLQAFP